MFLKTDGLIFKDMFLNLDGLSLILMKLFNFNFAVYTELYLSVLYWPLLYCTYLYYTDLYCTVLYWPVAEPGLPHHVEVARSSLPPVVIPEVSHQLIYESKINSDTILRHYFATPGMSGLVTCCCNQTTSPHCPWYLPVVHLLAPVGLHDPPGLSEPLGADTRPVTLSSH